MLATTVTWPGPPAMIALMEKFAVQTVEPKLTALLHQTLDFLILRGLILANCMSMQMVAAAKSAPEASIM
jgi:hypothetical protein